jgi:phage tail-like protein
METARRIDPFLNYNFLVELDGVAGAVFSEVSGLDSTIEPVEYREGWENTTVRKLPGKATYSNIVLKWGMTADMRLYDWYQQTVLGNVQRRNGSIIVLDRRGKEVARWNFVNAWPTKYDIPDFNATGKDVAIETLELVHEGVERKLVPVSS